MQYVMKTERFMNGYLSPEIEMVKVSAEGILCSSSQLGFGINNMDVKPGGAGTDWDWE
jgi:hypothetical protein